MKLVRRKKIPQEKEKNEFYQFQEDEGFFDHHSQTASFSDRHNQLKLQSFSALPSINQQRKPSWALQFILLHALPIPSLSYTLKKPKREKKKRHSLSSLTVSSSSSSFQN
ncbi:hypothetical protein Ancab_023240 [Ancistrocladus abbreviatus]